MSTTAVFDPTAASYDDEFALMYAMMELLGITDAEIKAGSHEIQRAFGHNGITKFYEHLLLCSPDDLINLEVPERAADKKLSIPKEPAHCISLLSGRRICALLAYFHHCCDMEGKLIDVTKLKPQGFKIFQMSLFSPAEPIVPFGKSRLKATNTELALWRKQVKMDPKQYKEFRDKAYWLTYKKHIISTLDAQELSHLIDVTYVVLNKELDKVQRYWFYKVLQDVIKQSTCKMIVNNHEDDKDTRAIWAEICEQMEKSMAAQISTSNISTYLTNTAKLSTSGWKGTQTNWLMHYKEQARKYNEIASSPYTGEMLVQFLENAVNGTPNLENVLRNQRTSRVASGNSTAIT